jgi:carboxyl-terminal processing protease
MRRALTLALVFACVGALGAYIVKRPAPADVPSESPSVAHDMRGGPAPLGPEQPDDLHFQVPGGGPTRITCSQARRVIAQVRSELSYEPEAVSPKELSSSASDWLDPHSFWSLPEDSPTSKAMDDAAPQLIAEIEGRGPDCSAARDVGRVLAAWSQELRKSFDAGDAEHVDVQGADSRDLPVDGTSPERAREVGRRAHAVRAALGDKADTYRVASRDRFFPAMDADAWAEVVLASTVRAYVPLVDPHGAWAPLDEKSSVYEVDLFAAPPEKPWGKVTVTAVGFRIDDHAVAPLQDNDVVVSVNQVLTVGMPLEQVEQLG